MLSVGYKTKKLITKFLTRIKKFLCLSMKVEP